MGRNTNINLFLVDEEDKVDLVRIIWKEGMTAMKDTANKTGHGNYVKEPDWNTRLKMMAFWKDCTIIRSRDVDNTYKDTKQEFDLKKVREKQREYQEKVN